MARPHVPFETNFIQDRLFAKGALDGLNEDARPVLYVIADTGLRLSEVVNLQTNAIALDDTIPHVKILPDGRRLKIADSQREVPLVGAALAAMRERPNGFPRYRDKSSNLSATVNKYLAENNLRPTKDHTVYSLRRVINGDPDAPLHAADLDYTSENLAAVSHFFRSRGFARLGISPRKFSTKRFVYKANWPPLWDPGE